MGSLQAALPGGYYTDDAHWAREVDRVLSREWFCAGRLATWGLGDGTSQRLAVIDVVGESVVATRARDGVLRAFYNVCRHRGSQVVPADPAVGPPVPCRAAAIRCPYHSWTYDLTGRLMRAPHTEDLDGFTPDDFGLREIEADSWGGFLFLRLAGSEGPTLRDSLGAIPDRVCRYPLDTLVIGHTLAYQVRANYKVILENYNQSYAGCTLPAWHRGASISHVPVTLPV